jgi:hypothetical protein
MSPAWLTAALTATGARRSGRVVAATWKRVGQDYGFTGVVARADVRYRSASDGLSPTWTTISGESSSCSKT